MGRRRDDRVAADRGREKICASCGRRIEWRAKWADDWDQVRYCSAACRRRKVRPVDEQLERTILQLLDRRARGASICPSEAARTLDAARRTEADRGPGRPGLAGDDDEPWRALVEPARRAARRLVAAGEVEITQRGTVVDPSTASGPIRIRRVR